MLGIPSYPKVFNIGHPGVSDLLIGDVRIEEKIDGSQFSFSMGLDGILRFRSRGADIDVDAPPKMFLAGVEGIKAKAQGLVPGYIYRGEYLAKPKHNTLAYDRVPQGNIILFDIETSPGVFLPHEAVVTFAANLGFETVPLLFEGHGSEVSMDWLRLALERPSVLGGQKIEGVVIKARARYGIDGKLLMGKHVSEKFKETHQGEWRKMNPAAGDILTQLVAMYRTPARWEKAIQHRREAGELLNAPQDIGPLLGEVRDDLLEECGVEIKEALMKYAWPRVVRGVQAGFAQFYKNKLAEGQFNGTASEGRVAGNGGGDVGADPSSSGNSGAVGDNVAVV